MVEEIKLSKPVEWEGATYDTLSFDLESLTGNDLLQAEKEFVLEGGVASAVELNKGYVSIVAARAAKVPVELIRALPAKDFCLVTLLVQNFLIR